MRTLFQMSRAPPKSQEFAERLIAHEARVHPSAKGTPGAFLVCTRLRPHLAVLVGSTGFDALLSRALALASAEVHWLGAVHVQADGTLEILAGRAAPADPEEMAEGGGALIIQLLGLLVAFIGEDLTMRLVDEAWPKLSRNDYNSGNGGRNEEAT
jgi:hypothetical protein